MRARRPGDGADYWYRVLPGITVSWGKVRFYASFGPCFEQGTLSPRDPLVNVVRVTFGASPCLKGDRAGDGCNIVMRRVLVGTDQCYVC
eukprot:11240142-Karenia_brevis.AAC.1